MNHPAHILAAPTGTVLAFAGPLPVQSGGTWSHEDLRTSMARDGWLFCDGQAYNRTDYARLYAVIGDAFGNGDGSTTFNVPDLRGRFVRGVDGGSGHDPDAGSRTASAPGGATGDNAGSLELDAFQGHEHLYTSTVESPDTAQPGGPPVLMRLPDQPTTSTAPNTNDQGRNDGTPRTSTETRPVNLALNYLIRYL